MNSDKYKALNKRADNMESIIKNIKDQEKEKISVDLSQLKYVVDQDKIYLYNLDREQKRHKK